MGGAAKALNKVHQSVRKFSPTARVWRAAIGDKAWDQAHFIGSANAKNVAMQAQAEKDGKDAEAAAETLRKRQATELAALDDEENRRIKKILTASRGARSYRGAPMFRGRAGNTAGAPTRTAAGGGSSSPSAGALRSGGARGGMRQGSGYRSLLP